MRIKNKEILISHGDVNGRKVALDIAEYAISSMSSYKTVNEIISLSDNILCVGNLSFDLNSIKNLFVFGAGKATFGSRHVRFQPWQGPGSPYESFVQGALLILSRDWSFPGKSAPCVDRSTG